MKIRKAVIPAAGFGTRFLPFTKELPKEMIPIIDTPTIDYIVDEAINAGIEEVILILSAHKKAIEKYFQTNQELEEFLIEHNKTNELNLVKKISNKVKVKVVIQDEQKGLGHAVLCAKELVNGEDFAVLLGDDVTVSEYPVIKQLIDAYTLTNSTVVGIQEVKLEDISKYGSIKYNDKVNENIFKVESMVEKPKPEAAPSALAVLGRYVLTNKIFELLEKQTAGVGGEIQLTDAINNLTQYENVYGCKFTGKRFDVGNPLGYLEATVDFAMSRNDTKNKMKEIIKKYSNV